MRQMKNVRTGQVAAFDAELVESGRWVEVVKEPTEEKVAKKGIKLSKLKATGSLSVESKESENESVKS